MEEKLTYGPNDKIRRLGPHCLFSLFVAICGACSHGSGCGSSGAGVRRVVMVGRGRQRCGGHRRRQWWWWEVMSWQ